MWGKRVLTLSLFDFDLISTAHRELNIAGVGNILSIHTATYNWKLAHKGVPPFPRGYPKGKIHPR